MPLRGPPSSSSQSAFSAGCFQGLGRGTPHPPRCQRGLAPFHTGQVENRAGPARLTRRECSAFPAPMIARGQGRALGGLRPEDWESSSQPSPHSCTARCGRGLCAAGAEKPRRQRPLLTTGTRAPHSCGAGRGPGGHVRRQTRRIRPGGAGKGPVDPLGLLTPWWYWNRTRSPV